MRVNASTLGGAALLFCWLPAAASAQNATQFSGVAAFYSTDYSGRTACGQNYDPSKFTAAHRTLPFGTRLRVTDPQSHRSVIVVVNDRGPFTKGRVLDLSLAAAKALRMTSRGLMKVTAAIEPAAAFTTATVPAKP
jgi:rare lipoprotein A